VNGLLVTASDVRTNVLGLSESEAPDSLLNHYIEVAFKEVLREISIPVEYEEMSGEINGSNTEFEVDHTPIADTNFDGTVDGNDITVYLWEEDDYTQATVSSVNALKGVITLSSAPSSSIDKVTCSYRYYYSDKIKPNEPLLKEVVMYYAGMLFLLREYLLVPIESRFGGVMFDYSAYSRSFMPYERLEKRVRELLDRLRGFAVSKGEFEK